MDAAVKPKEPKDPKPSASMSTGSEVARVQFHTGVQFRTWTTTGVAVEQARTSRKDPTIAVRLVGPGVWVRVGGEEFVVPFSNVLWVALA